MEPKKFKICMTVEGSVQGVGFRWFVQRHAERLGVHGFVKNLPGQKVYTEAEGTEAELIALIALIKRGPSSSYVTDSSVTWSEFKNEFNLFEIRH